MRLDSATLTENLRNMLRTIIRYRVLLFVVVVSVVYGYVVYMIGSLGSAQPSPASEDTSATNISVPKIDQSIVTQLQTLRDNNVSVQTLFEQARDNPFNE